MILNHRTRMCAYDCEICSSNFSDNKLFNEAHTNGRSSHPLTAQTFLFQMETPPLRCPSSTRPRPLSYPFLVAVRVILQGVLHRRPSGPFVDHSQPRQASPN